MARAVAHHTECTFIRVSGSELVQKFIGEGSRMVRELFILARFVVFIDLTFVLFVAYVIDAGYNTRQKFLGHLQKYDKQPYSSQLLHPYALHAPPSPPPPRTMLCGRRDI